MKTSEMEKRRLAKVLEFVIELMTMKPVWQGTPTDLCFELEDIGGQDQRYNHWWQTYITVRLKRLKEELVSAGIIYEKIYHKGQCMLLFKKVEPQQNISDVPITIHVDKDNNIRRCINCRWHENPHMCSIFTS